MKRTVAEQATIEFEAALRANNGRLVPPNTDHQSDSDYYEFRAANGHICCAGSKDTLCPKCRAKARTTQPVDLRAAGQHNVAPPPPDMSAALRNSVKLKR
jgi:hypothetical protein